MLYVYAPCEIKPGSLEEFCKAVTPLIEGTRAEEGNISYSLCAESDVKVAFLEQWKDEAALKSHAQAPHYLAAKDAFGAYLTKPIEVHVLKVLPV